MIVVQHTLVGYRQISVLYAIHVQRMLYIRCTCQFSSTVSVFMIGTDVGRTLFTSPIMHNYYKKESCQYYFVLTFYQNGLEMLGVRLTYHNP